jgi:hypothetical protein
MGNVPDGWRETPGRKKPKRKPGGPKNRRREKLQTEARLEQPIAESNGNVLCEICHHPVDPRRMHPHMVRFHGVAIRKNG